MKRIRALSSIAAILMLVASTAQARSIAANAASVPLLSSRDSICMPNDTSATKFLHWTQQIVSDTDSLGVKLRARVGIPKADSSAVHLVTDETLCRRASLAADSSGNMPAPTNGRVHLARIGTGYYAIHRVGWTAGEWGIVLFVDGAFTARNAWVMY